MKISKYIIYIDQGKFKICYNTNTDLFLLLSNADYERLQNSIALLEETSPSVYEKMVNGKFIIDDGIDELSQLKEEYDNAVNHSETYDLTLLPTLDCNLRCWYCYEKHQIGTHFVEGIADSIVEHIKRAFRENENLKALSVTMYGGEPLMYFKEELYPLLSELKRYMDSLGKHSSFFFITNATYIKEDMVPMFEYLGTGFQISIDGSKEKHNKVKFLPKTKVGTFDGVMQTVRMLTSKMENVFINLRVNYDDETLPHLTELIKEIEDVDRTKISIHFERVWQTTDKAVNFNNRQLQQILGAFINNGFSVSYMNLHRKSLSCKASSTEQIIVSFDGKVYKCTGRDFTEEFSDGKLQPDGSILWKPEQIRQRMCIRTYDNPKCLKCLFLPQCWGPCNKKLLESDNIDRFCQLNLMEMELNDFLVLRLKNHYMEDKIKELKNNGL